MTSDGETTKMKIVDLEKLWNFAVDNIFIWNRLGRKQSIYAQFSIICGEPKSIIGTCEHEVQW
jgi:hypothetical protein